ncbi:PREDICTED: leucine--tRNA ligase, cytoplasmic-like [Fragaria vesca subsp. vesca]|uniref:leucine--tRNA ligase, cytoplasmic-like n=1 Tax=Fragaria vesca subsp. vesca TaxID=101020 RepID=UPI0002C2F5E2|nr:PREDICTED: leucine--tRNA ligase, cytoplasmic-like [Fragaria vesca subsp. vesca]
MAAKGDTSSSKVRGREFLLEIEAKVRKWWEDEKVFSAECEKPGHKFFGKFPFDSFMGNPFSLSKLEWLPDIPIDVMRFALVYVCDGAVDEAKINSLHSNAASVYNAANTAILKFNEEMSWHEEFLAADFDSYLRCGPPSTFADRVFANEINIALNRTKEQYEAGQFRGALDSIFELQDARDWYKISCGGTNAMNRDLVWRFMDVQTCLITPICPHYAEYVWRDLLHKIDFVVNADWPVADAPDESILQSADKYLKDLIDSMKRQVESERNKKGTALATTSLTEERQKLEALIYVNEAGDTHTLATKGLHTDSKQNGNEFKQTAKVKFGDQYLYLKLPFREKVLLQNVDFIKREIGLDKVQVLSATNPCDLAKAGSPVKMSDAESSSRGNPAALSMTCPEKDFRLFGASKTTPLLADLSSSGFAPKHTNPKRDLVPLFSTSPESTTLTKEEEEEERLRALEAFVERMKLETSNASTSKGNAREEEELRRAMAASMESGSGSTSIKDPLEMFNFEPTVIHVTEVDEEVSPLWSMADLLEESSASSSKVQNIVTREEEDDEELQRELVASLGSWWPGSASTKEEEEEEDKELQRALAASLENV